MRPSFLAGLLGGAVAFNPRIAMVGDSISQYGHNWTTLNAVTLTRTSNVVNVAKAAHGLTGNPLVYIGNITDPSFETQALATIVDANNFTYPNTGADGSTTGTANGFYSRQDSPTRVGYWHGLQSRARGGLRFVGNWGQGGDRADEMTAAMTAASATAADVVVLLAGTNDLNAAASAATILTRVTALVNIGLAAGKKIILCGPPAFSGAFATSAKYTQQQALYSGLAAIAAGNPSNIKYADLFTPIWDVTSTVTGSALANMLTDGIHPGSNAADLFAAAIYAKLIEWYPLVDSLIPATSAVGAPTVNGWTPVAQYGSWDGTGGGFVGTGYSGTVAAGNFGINTNALTTTVASLVDRGGGLGYYQRLVSTPGGANHSVVYYFKSNSSVTLASLGLTTGDEVAFGIELSASGLVAAGVVGISLQINSQSPGTSLSMSHGVVSSGQGVTGIDSFTDQWTFCGGGKLIAGVTGLAMNLTFRVAAASANTFQADIGRVVLYKKTA